jgi:hypothetical protein
MSFPTDTSRRAAISSSAGRDGSARPCSIAETNERVIGEPSSACVSPACTRSSRMRDPKVAAFGASSCEISIQILDSRMSPV